MFNLPMMVPPPSAWAAPAMAEFLSTPLWTWPVICAVLLELFCAIGCCALLWHFGAPSAERRSPKRPRRSKRIVRAVTPIWYVRSRRRAA